MNFTVVNVVMFGTGAILVYSAITNRNPVDVVKFGIQGKLAPQMGTNSSFSSATPPASGKGGSGQGSGGGSW